MFSTVSRDITDVRKIQESMRLTQLGQLVSTMAHEVNNPIMIISGNAQLALMEETLPADVRKYIKTIFEECGRTRDIIQRLLKFSRPSKGVLAVTDIGKIIETVTQIVQHQFSLSGVQVRVVPPSLSLPMVKVDVQQMHEVFMNLLNNARDAMPNGGTIDIRTGIDNGRLRIDIKDTGSGIQDEILKKIFDPFFTTKEKGTGLGLAICNNIVKGQNGELSVSSIVGEGTTFTILLPLSSGE